MVQEQKTGMMNLLPPDQVIMLDIEASSLKGASGKKSFHDLISYPVEVGLAKADGQPESRLIKPEDDWTDWNGEAKNNDIGLIHGISRRELIKKGHNVREVAQWLNQEIGDKTVMCDSPDAVLDSFWLDRLFQAAGIERQFNLRFLYDYIDMNDPLVDEAYKNSEIERESEHRAGEDAADIMNLYREYYVLKIAEYHENLINDGPSAL